MMFRYDDDEDDDADNDRVGTLLWCHGDNVGNRGTVGNGDGDVHTATLI